MATKTLSAELKKDLTMLETHRIRTFSCNLDAGKHISQFLLETFPSECTRREKLAEFRKALDVLGDARAKDVFDHCASPFSAGAFFDDFILKQTTKLAGYTDASFHIWVYTSAERGCPDPRRVPVPLQ